MLSKCSIQDNLYRVQGKAFEPLDEEAKEQKTMIAWSEGDVAVNGTSLHYYRTGETHKPPLVLLHGVTDNGLCWSRVAHALQANYEVILLDARGHGRSGLPPNGFSRTVLADDTVAMIGALELHQPVLFGHSMGAMTALAVAATSPELVRALIVEDPPLRDQPPRSPSNAPTGQWLFTLQALSREECIAQGFAQNPAWVEEEVIPWADSKAQVRSEVVAHMGTFITVPWRELLPHITCPILLLTGDPERGAIVTPAIAQEAAHLWQQGEVHRINGAGHSIHRDRYEETMTVVQAFLAAHALPS